MSSDHQLILERFSQGLLGVDQAIISEQLFGTGDDRVLQIEAVAYSIQVKVPRRPRFGPEKSRN